MALASDRSREASSLQLVAELLEPAKNVFVLTGAGLSAEAHLPTYRGANGLWSQVDPRRFTSLNAFENDPHTVWSMCSTMRDRIANTEPSPAHLALARLAQGARRVTLATQNVDGLHDRAARSSTRDNPSPAFAAEIHGNIWRLRCLNCGHRFMDNTKINPDHPPSCPECGNRTRPDIVWFGENPHRAALVRAASAAQRCDLCLVIGTSALVAPASKLPLLASSHGAPLVEINPDPTRLSDIARASLRMSAGKALAALI